VRELEAAYAGDRRPLSILHDVAWPCARRDQYYAPRSIPEDGRLPHSYEKGRDPDSAELVDVGGFHGEFEFAVALREGGESNGVLTAVEDFLAARDDLEYREVEAVFGVGYVFAKEAPYAPQLRELLDPWHQSTLVARMERNRVRLYARVLELQDRLRRAGLGTGRVSLAFEDRIEALEAENAALRLESARLRERLAQHTPS
jgi:hypothetical protein